MQPPALYLKVGFARGLGGYTSHRLPPLGRRAALARSLGARLSKQSCRAGFYFDSLRGSTTLTTCSLSIRFALQACEYSGVSQS